MGTWVLMLVTDKEQKEFKLLKILLFPVMDVIAIDEGVLNKESRGSVVNGIL